MLGFTETFGIIAGIFSFSAYLFYIAAILKGQTKPSRATWFIWAVMGIILAVSYKASGAEDTMWVPISEAVAPTIIALLAIKYGTGGAEKIDLVCFAGSVFSLFLWWMSGSAVVALITNLSIDLFAAIPTIKKARDNPSSENRTSWTITEAGELFNLFAIDRALFAVIIFPVYRLVIDGLITGLLYKPAFQRIKYNLQEKITKYGKNSYRQQN